MRGFSQQLTSEMHLLSKARADDFAQKRCQYWKKGTSPSKMCPLVVTLSPLDVQVVGGCSIFLFQFASAFSPSRSLGRTDE